MSMASTNVKLSDSKSITIDGDGQCVEWDGLRAVERFRIDQMSSVLCDCLVALKSSTNTDDWELKLDIQWTSDYVAGGQGYTWILSTPTDGVIQSDCAQNIKLAIQQAIDWLYNRKCDRKKLVVAYRGSEVRGVLQAERHTWNWTRSIADTLVELNRKNPNPHDEYDEYREI